MPALTADKLEKILDDKLRRLSEQLKQALESISTLHTKYDNICAIFHMRVIRENVLPKFITLCMERPWLCPFEGHKYGCRKPTETFVFEFSY